MLARYLTLVLSIIIVSTTSARAGVAVEPFVGYATGEWKQGSTSAKHSGVGYGARLGWDFGMVRVGGSYLGGTTTDTASPISNKIAQQDIGAFVEADFSRVVVRLGYGATSQGIFTPSTGTANTWKGTSMNAGIGVELINHINFNIDYVSTSHDQLNGATVANKLTNNFFVVGVSFPFEFGGKK